MAALKNKIGRRILYTIPLVVFLILFALTLERSRTGRWHAVAIDLWQKQKWSELRSLAENLYQTGQPDPESMLLAMLASAELKNPEGTRLFAERLAEQKLLNLPMERELKLRYQPDQPRKMISLYRTKMVLSICGLLSILIVLCLRHPKRWLPWMASASIAGCIVLLL